VSDRPELFDRKCSTCVFHPGNRMSLQPGRLAELVARNRETGSLLICHHTTFGQRPDGEVMCRGYFDAYAAESRVAQIMESLFGPDWYSEVPAP
jgi:hypothetical protein